MINRVVLVDETWKPVTGYEGLYEVSNYGNVRRLKKEILQRDGRVRSFPEKILNAHKNTHGYLALHLSKGNKRVGIRVHRVVAQAFIPNPENKQLVNHKDGNKLNNNVGNLEWSTSKENNNHAYENGLIRSNIRKYESEIMTEYTVQGATIRGLSRKYGCARDSIRNLFDRKGVEKRVRGKVG